MSGAAEGGAAEGAGGPVHVVVMGVSGSGKTAVATALGRALGLEVIEGDAHHPAANVAKMAAGEPLTDADREPWLHALAALTAARRETGASTVLACSALRRAYRDVLRSAVPATSTYVVHLAVSEATAVARMADRTGHFMPTDLAASQFATLEPLGPDEQGTTIDAEQPLDDVIAAATTAVRAWIAEPADAAGSVNETFKKSWGGWIHSSRGYSIRVGSRTGVEYRDRYGELRIDAERMSQPWFEVVVYTGSIPDTAQRRRAEVVNRLQRAFDFARWKLTIEDVWHG